MEALAAVPAGFAAFGLVFAAIGALAARRFARRPIHTSRKAAAVTVLKPLCGFEFGLDEALASFCQQDHPELQIVFGLQDPDDPAIAVVQRLRRRFPATDITLVIDPTPHGSNRKIANLLNMLPYARHDLLVFADSDQHVGPDYLCRVQAALDAPGVGLVTTLNVGGAAVGSLAARLGATHLSHTFLPGALLSRAMGRQDCLGTTMALSRETLRRVGGLQALSPHLADDNVLGQLVLGLGLSVALADTVPVTAVQERSLRELWSHELRWARTIAALAPWAYGASSLQYPIVWAGLACLVSGCQYWSLLLLAASWTTRVLAAGAVNRALRPRVGERLAPVSAWLLPLRDLLSMAELVASFLGSHVVWRGHAMRADAGRPRPAVKLVRGMSGVGNPVASLQR